MNTEESKKPPLDRGLQGIHLDRTYTTFIDGTNGTLEYRGYSIADLAENSNFEETAYLILNGELPTQNQLQEFAQRLKENRKLPDKVIDAINIVKDSHPMDVLRTAVSVLSSCDSEINDNSLESVYRKGIALTSQVACIVMTHHRIRNGLDPIEPNREISHAANFLYMMNGELPSEEHTSIMDQDFVLHADHGLNASAFTARVVASTGADYYSAITSAIATLSGPLHGGAAENVMHMINEIETPDHVEEYISNLLKNRQRVMGFGHRVYKSIDPRASHLRKGLRALIDKTGEQILFMKLENIQKAMHKYTKHGIYANVDFFAGVIYHLLGIPKELFVPIFAVGRVPGWTIQIIEQLQRNILIRPMLRYEGKRQRNYIHISER